MNNWTFLEFFFLLSVAETVYFSLKEPELCLPSLHGAGSVVGRVYAYPSIVDNCTELKYSLAADEKRFVINSTGWIIAQYQVLATDVISLQVTADCQSSQASTMVTVRLYENLVNISGNLTNELLEQTCFSFHADSAFYIEENTNNVLFGQLNSCWLRYVATRMYQVLKPKSLVSIDQRTSEITLIKQLDRDTLLDKNNSNKDLNISGIQPLRISCEVRIGNITYPAVKRRFYITVMDVNDNPPFFIYHNNSQHISKSCTFDDQRLRCVISDEIVVDIDSYRNNSHAVQVVSDPLDVCRASIKCVDPNLGKTVCRLMTNIQNLSNITTTPYTCKVAVIDTFLIRRMDSNNDNLASLEVTINQSARCSSPDLSLQSTVRFYRNATRFARLLQLNSLTPNIRYTMVDAIFHVTPKTGIIYLNNLEPLSSAPDILTINIMESSGQNISIDVVLHGKVGRKGQCDKGCSKQSSELSCFQACGFGLRGGNCVMRGKEFNSKMDVNYGTCTHDIGTCPDRFCDELEDLNPLLCPQDCVTEVIGAAELNKNQARGIVRAESPCWCEEDLGAVVCHCVPEPFSDNHGVQFYLANNSEATVSMTNNTVTHKLDPNGPQLVKDDDVYNKTEIAEITVPPGAICNNECKIAVGVIAVAVAMVSFTLFMLWFTKIRGHRTGNAKRVGSVTSLSATIPSEYPDDRERRSSSAENLVSPKGQNSTTQVDNMYTDSKKWEILRERLTLEKTLGEGEFGLVIKASLLQEDKTMKHVAVKMLKHCSSQLEEQDLMSEFNVLKDVSHPNVIRLLGACTVNGPFYLVVEFCENGCLLKYLRQSRLEENGYINSDVRFRCHNAQQQTDQYLEGGLLTLRDLFSFAWQIAKGMSYLSEIKLVHRDLAARNILVASGNVLKVSDFGLTRDVYEADTYLKKSKGRIPVKWLAPESLYAQVYTTRSDLWSYGIVLWEIVTLGAPPYPGIPPERLYNLIIRGYRMDRPENCPEEMYAVMQKCWKYDPADRPSFAILAGIFDRMLQEKTGYMDLSICDGRVIYNKCFNENVPVRAHSCLCNDETIQCPSEDRKVTLSSNNDTDITECNNTKTESKMCNNAETEVIVCGNTYMEVTMCSNTDTEVTMYGNTDTEVTMYGNTDTEVTMYGNTATEVTMCNNTSDDYLTPSSIVSDLDDSKINNSMPLRDTERLSEKLYMCWGRTNMLVGRNDSASKFPKKNSNSLKCSKTNKSVIYPSERISLLTDTGVARCAIKNDNALQIETTQF